MQELIGIMVSVGSRLGLSRHYFINGVGKLGSFPIPSEIIIPPAAYWALQGRYSMTGVILAGTFGSYLGAAATYWGARWLGTSAAHSLWFVHSVSGR